VESSKNQTPLQSKPAIGFLTVMEHPQHGLFGGYLVLNLAGRPLEFHCTAPVKPNRAQQILYGPTLESFLYGEQIGATLLGHAKTKPLVVCTDCEPVLSLGELVDLPVALVLPPEGLAQNGAMQPGSDGDGQAGKPDVRLRVDAQHARGPRLISFELGRNRLALSQQKGDDRKRLAEQLGEAAAALDLWEPFTRIREAIEEAQQAAR
jgi:hypothetical protein